MNMMMKRCFYSWSMVIWVLCMKLPQTCILHRIYVLNIFFLSQKCWRELFYSVFSLEFYFSSQRNLNFAFWFNQIFRSYSSRVKFWVLYFSSFHPRPLFLFHRQIMVVSKGEIRWRWWRMNRCLEQQRWIRIQCEKVPQVSVPEAQNLMAHSIRTFFNHDFIGTVYLWFLGFKNAVNNRSCLNPKTSK